MTLVALRHYNCLDVKQEEGLLRANIGSITVVVEYASPNQAIGDFTNFLNRMEWLVRTANREVLVCGDLNAKSPMWSGNDEDERGRLLADTFAALNLFVLNDGRTPTFIRGSSNNFLDVALPHCTQETSAGESQKWKIYLII